MCGISGFCRAQKSSIPHGGKLAIEMALSIEDRGKDATGFAWSEKNDAVNVWYSKRPGRAKNVAARLDLPQRGIGTLLAHTRHFTKGSPSNNDNNHPVVADHIVAVHNGRIDNDDELIDLAGLAGKRLGSVDSWAIPALLSKQAALGVSHPTELLELVEGVAAIAWQEGGDPTTLHLARLSTRPLCVAWTKRGDLLFSSTPRNLTKAMTAAKVGFQDLTVLKEGTYLRVSDGGIQDWTEFKVRHPVRPVQLDIPGMRNTTVKSTPKAKAGKPKSKPSKGGVMSHAEWVAYCQDRDAERVTTTDATANLDGFEPWEDHIDWDSLIPRRGWMT
jgi:glucosamine 6-phosphate synthetase-like amidotransferase/phosphosugar isomerase protein